MNLDNNYLEYNKKAWNDKVQYHVESEFYSHSEFLKGQTSLKKIELDLLGDVSGKKILHVQCHFGQDTISLARMGAETVGVDFSEDAIRVAKEAAAITNANARFICCDVYSLPENLNETFDIVFTSYGTIGWLPDLDKWAKVVSRFLKPGGTFVFAEFHPVVWMFDGSFSRIEYAYLKDDAIVEAEEGTYADSDAPLKNTTVNWNHGLSEVISRLLQNGLTLTDFKEYDYSPYNCFSGMDEFEKGKFRIEKLGRKLPMVYSLIMKK
ncbi:class I SAM-dependent methyltransferase [Flavobacterium silvaticum]|uniref:Methyltransferase domain-containing protein n=1 Tax=Flavobacterium silvaticum TaxID=1852020 RepID=A0A972FNS5_9FLAO|nr:class I SAM-dependent methyltransferase [Flavobacterium silvaticum]NMH29072.1 methyltransferase domain-containing protein [Flavobacterium silvaticum]